MADPIGSGLAAAIVKITNVGGHEGLNVQIEKGVYGASEEVTARYVRKTLFFQFFS